MDTTCPTKTASARQAASQGKPGPAHEQASADFGDRPITQTASIASRFRKLMNLKIDCK
jgi:hypothetical protein